MNIKPLDDRVVVEPLEAEKKTEGGIVLPDTAKEKPIKGKVVAVGPGLLSAEGKRQKLSLKKGDLVIFGKFSGTEYKCEGKELLIMKETDVLAKVE